MTTAADDPTAQQNEEAKRLSAAEWKAWRGMACTEQMLDAIAGDIKKTDAAIHEQSRLIVRFLNAELDSFEAKAAVDEIDLQRERRQGLVAVMEAMDGVADRTAAYEKKLAQEAEAAAPAAG